MLLRSLNSVWQVLLLIALLLAPRAWAQTDPRTLPLVQAGDLTHLGTFALPLTDGVKGHFGDDHLGGGVSEDGTLLYVACGTRFAAVRIPSVLDGRVAAIAAPCQGPDLAGISSVVGSARAIGGLLVQQGRMVVTAYDPYDGGGLQAASHFVGGSLTSMGSAIRLPGALTPRRLSGYMATIPAEWRTLFGGPALTGQCCISIIGSTSAGPNAAVFDPENLAKPVKEALGYTLANPLAPPEGRTSPLWNRASRISTMAFPAGTRSVLYAGIHGPDFCYGQPTTDPAMHRAPNPAAGPKEIWCYTLTGKYKGDHSFPDQHQVWAYDAAEMADVVAGTRAAHSLRPYAVWTLPQIRPDGRRLPLGGAYDASSRRLYLTQQAAGGQGVVHVYEVRGGSPPPPPTPPTITAFTASPSEVQAGGTVTLAWTASDPGTIDQGIGAVGASGTRTVTVTAATAWTLTVTNAAGSVSRTAAVTIAQPPPPPTKKKCVLTLAELDRVLDGIPLTAQVTMVCQ